MLNEGNKRENKYELMTATLRVSTGTGELVY